MNEQRPLSERGEIEPPTGITPGMLYESAQWRLVSIVGGREKSAGDFMTEFARLQSENQQYSDEARGLIERVKEERDYAVLAGIPIAEETEKFLKDRYADHDFARATQEALLDAAGTDIDAAVIVASDKRFTQQFELFRGFSDADRVEELYGRVADQPAVLKSLVLFVEDADFAERILRDMSRQFGSAQEQSDDKAPHKFSLEPTRRQLADFLLRKHFELRVLELVRQSCLSLGDIREFHEFTDDLLGDFALASRDGNVSRVIKLISDPDVLKRVAQGLREAGHEKAAEQADVMAMALGKPAIVTEAAPLIPKKDNKFVMAVDTAGAAMHIAWSNMEDYEYHKDIFTKVERAAGVRFQNAIRAGGYIKFTDESDGRLVATFCRSSGDFGPYQLRIVELYREQLVAQLQSSLGRDDIDVVIDPSS